MAIEITYFVHGTTTDNEKGLATGWAPGELSTLGRTQAVSLGEQVKNKTFDVIFCSDLKRAVESAELGFGSKYRIIQDERLRECDYGDLTQKPNIGKEGHINDPFPNGESYKDVEARIRNFLEFLKKEYPDKHIGIVAHQAPQLALEVITKHIPWEEAFDTDWRKINAWKPGWKYSIE